MAQLRHDYPRFMESNTEIIVVGPDDAAAFVRFWDINEMPFVGLSDSGHTVSDIYEQQVNWIKLGRMPALFLIDLAGNIRYAHHSDSMSDIPTNAEILSILEKI